MGSWVTLTAGPWDLLDGAEVSSLPDGRAGPLAAALRAVAEATAVPQPSWEPRGPRRGQPRALGAAWTPRGREELILGTQAICRSQEL